MPVAHPQFDNLLRLTVAIRCGEMCALAAGAARCCRSILVAEESGVKWPAGPFGPPDARPASYFGGRLSWAWARLVGMPVSAALRPWSA